MTQLGWLLPFVTFDQLTALGVPQANECTSLLMSLFGSLFTNMFGGYKSLVSWHWSDSVPVTSSLEPRPPASSFCVKQSKINTTSGGQDKYSLGESELALFANSVIIGM